MKTLLDLLRLGPQIAFGGDSGGGGGGGGGSSSSNDSSSSSSSSSSTTTTTPTFNSLTEASNAGYHGQAVNIAGKGLQKVEFADKSYDNKMSQKSNNANKSTTTTTTTSSSSPSTTTTSSSSDDNKSSSIIDDILMGAGVKEKDQDFVDRTTETILKTQGADAASTYAKQMGNDGFVDNYNEPEPEKEEKKTIGQVSATGQYAGDGFEWVESGTTEKGSSILTRTYTGAGKDNGLGQEVLFGNTADKALKETIATISLNEGSAFAGSKASATDIPANDFGIPTGFFPASDSFAEQVGQADYTPTVKYGSLEDQIDADQKTFADTFAEERAKQGDGGTFTYEGKEYTTNLASEEKPVETGPAFDYTGVSMGELGRGAPEGTLPPGTDPKLERYEENYLEMLSSLKNKDPDLLTSGEYLAATDYENKKAESAPISGTQVASAGSLSGLTTDFQPLLVDDVEFLGFPEADPMSAQEASFDQPDTDFAKYFDPNAGLTEEQLRLGLPTDVEPEKESLKDSIIKVLGGEDIISRALGISDSPLGDAQKAISTGLVEGAGTVGVGLGQTYDQIFKQDDNPLTPYDESGLYKAGQKIFDFGQEMSDKFSEMSDSYEGDQEIYKNLKSYDDVVGYGPGQVDRTLLQAAGKKPGDIVQMGADTGFDLSTAIQQGLKGAGSTAGPLVASALNIPAGILTGLASQKGELSIGLNNFIENDPRIANTELYRKTLAENNGDDALARNAIKQIARGGGRTDLAALGLGGGGTAAQVALLNKANPIAGILGTGLIEAGQEGPGESFATNTILNTLMPELGLPMDKKDILESSTAGLGGGVTVAGPITGIQQLAAPKGPDVTTEGPKQPGGDQTFTPTSATAGQMATDPLGIQTEYEKAAGLRPDTETSAESLLRQQLAESTSKNSVLDFKAAGEALDAAGVSLNEDQLTESIKTAQEQHTNDLIDQFRLQAEESVRENNKLSEDFINNMRTQLELNTGLDATRANETANKIVSDAFNNRFFTPTGQKLYQAQLEAALEKPPAGIEKAMFVRSPDVTTEGPTMGTGQTEEQLRLGLDETQDTAPKLSPFTEEGRKGIASLNTPAKLNLSPAENVEAKTSIPAVDKTTPASPTPFTPEGRKQIEVQTGPSKVNLSPAENVEGTTNIPAVEQTAVQEEQTKDETKTVLPVIEQTILPGEDEEETVEVEVDDTTDTATETETGATVEIDLPFVPPEVTTDSDGNDSFKCPDDTYTLVAGPDGPICKKDVKRSRMRAGRSLNPYTRLNIPEGYKGPGQKTKTVTSVETAPVSS